MKQDSIIISNQLIEFINNFEKQLMGYLETPISIESNANYKFSDWDLNCKLKRENISISTLTKIDNIVRSSHSLSGVGLLLPISNKYKSSRLHHIENSKLLHYMGFMTGVNDAPFFDLRINGVPNLLIRTAFPNYSDEEFESWIALTAWRKLLNVGYKGDEEDYKWHINGYSLVFDNGSLLENNPIEYFKSLIKPDKYEDAIAFLKF